VADHPLAAAVDAVEDTHGGHAGAPVAGHVVQPVPESHAHLPGGDPELPPRALRVLSLPRERGGAGHPGQGTKTATGRHSSASRVTRAISEPSGPNAAAVPRAVPGTGSRPPWASRAAWPAVRSSRGKAAAA